MYKTETVVSTTGCLYFNVIKFGGLLCVCVFFLNSLCFMMSDFGESGGELTYLSTERINIHSGRLTGPYFACQIQSKGC